MKRNFLFAGVFGLLIMTLSCAGGREMAIETPPPFEVAVAYSQPWAAGTQLGGRGTILTILLAQPEPGIELVMVYFNERWQDLTTTLGQPERYKAAYTETEIYTTAIEVPNMEQFSLSPSQAMVYYLKNKRPNLALVSDIELRPLLAYPSNNPND